MNKSKNNQCIISNNFALLLLTILFLVIPSTLGEINANQNPINISIDYSTITDNDNYASFSNQEITLSNNGTISENVTISIMNLNSNFKEFSLDTTNFIISANSNVIVKLAGKASAKLSPGTHSNIGELRISSSSGTKIIPLSAYVIPMIEIKRITVEVNGSSDQRINDDEDEINNLKPGDKVQLNFELENLYDEDYNDGDLDGTISVQLDDNDFGDEIDEETDFSLDAGDSSSDEEISLIFDVPEEAEEGEYALEIKVEAEDSNNVKYTIEWNIDLLVERDRNDIRISEFNLNPSEISCYRRFQVNTEITNYGSNSLRNNLITLRNDKLGLSSDYSFDLNKGTDSDNSEYKTFFFDIDQNKAAGTYDLTLSLYYDSDNLGDRKIAQLIINDCATSKKNTTTSTTTNQSKNQTNTNQNSQNDYNTNSENNPTINTVDNSYSDSEILFGIMIVGIVLLVILIVLFFVVLIK